MLNDAMRLINIGELRLARQNYVKMNLKAHLHSDVPLNLYINNKVHKYLHQN